MYIPRVVDKELVTLLSSVGGVVIEGPKACGKTETARQVRASEVRLDVDANARQMAAIDPSRLLEGDTPRLFDEWQMAPQIWNHVRRAIDDRKKNGQFILTGSAVPADDMTRHTGAGRLARLKMRPMSLFESGHSTGEVSLSALLEGEETRAGASEPGIGRLAGLIVSGGWPALVEQPTEAALRSVRAYLDEVRRTDIQRVDGVAHEPERVLQFLRSIARNVATLAGIATLAKDVSGSGDPIHRETATNYHDSLTRLMVVEDQPAWAPHIRSTVRLRSTPKRHFVDPSLAAAALHLTPERLFQDLNFMGLLFESMVIRDLRVYSQALNGRVLHYQDETGLEVDVVIELADGRWGAFEVKLGAGSVDDGAKTLLRFADRVDTTKVGGPAVMGVVVGGGYGYRRPDGIEVIPVTSLGP